MGMESPKSARKRLMTPAVQDRGGNIYLNPPGGGFFVADQPLSPRFPQHEARGSSRREKNG
jgi:hypothetical protein